jgi:uncharacterized membrane protein
MDMIARALPWVVAMLLFAALTHFIAILILPAVATRDAYDRLEAWGKSDHMVLMPPVAPGRAIIPFRDPATVQGMCFYDLAKAPVRVKTTVEEGRLLTLSFRTREGKIFYAMNDRAALRDTIDIRLLSEGQLAAVEASEDEDRGLSAELRLKAPTAEGLIVATALVARPSEREDAEARIKAISCAPEPLPPG